MTCWNHSETSGGTGSYINVRFRPPMDATCNRERSDAAIHLACLLLMKMATTMAAAALADRHEASGP